MKKKVLSVSLILASLLSLGSLSSCSKEVEVKTYGVIASSGSSCVASCDMKVSSGKVTSVSFDETFTPNYWARGLATPSGYTIPTIDVDVTSYSGSVTTIKIAQYISIGGYQYNGTLSTNTTNIGYGEYVTYTANDQTTAPSTTYDLYSYIKIEDANGNKGSRAGWYYQCLAEGYGKTESQQNSRGETIDVQTGFSVLGYSGSSTTLVSVPGITVNMPGSLFKNSEDSTYWTTGTLGWKGNMEKIEKALVGLSLSSDTLTKITSSDGVYAIDGTSSGATITSFSQYIQLAVWSFAQAEYDSYGL